MIEKGSRGRCGTRRAGADFLQAANYGQVSSLNIDPIEKKPLYHYHPGEDVVSVGSLGCNLSCDHCQNHTISQTKIGERDTMFVEPEKLRELCRSKGIRNLAFTYNEPTIWQEYVVDVLRGQEDLHGILVTNGYVNLPPLQELCEVVKAVNMDIKGFTYDFYRNLCHGSLAPVLESAKFLRSRGIHLELTYLIIPGRNDDRDELQRFCEWVTTELGTTVPVHFTRFHPDYLLMDLPDTPLEILTAARDIAYEEELEYVYIGNAPVHIDTHTYCPSCGEMVIHRKGYETEILQVEEGHCQVCGKKLDIIQ
jgi:pyruvate formate lyase activating enzyme